MTRKEVKELLPIIKAFCDGKTIQHLDIIKDKWEDIDEFVYHGSVKSYRIKPDSQPKYRPFANTEECWKEMEKHQPFGWVKDKKDGHHVLITAVDDDTCGNAAWSLSGIMDSFTFADGAPFGVKEEE